MSTAATPRPWAARVGMLTLACVLVGLNLRGPIVGIPPLLDEVRAAYSLGTAQAGLLTSLPLLCFALLSAPVARLARRFDVDKVLLVSIILLAAATALRPFLGWGGMLAGTIIIALAITAGNVLLPVVIRRDTTPNQTPTVMAISTSSYALGAAVAAYLAVPIATAVGWQWSLASLSLISVAALAAWMIRMRATRLEAARRAEIRQENRRLLASNEHLPLNQNPWKMGEVWWMAAFFSVQSTLFYTSSTWLPDLLRAQAGISEATAGTGLSIFHLCGVIGTLLVPVIARLAGSYRRASITIAFVWAALYLIIVFIPELWLGALLLGGFAQGAGFGMALTLVALRPATVDFSGPMSGMVQSVGYGLAAIGPVAVGALIDAAGTYLVAAYVMIGLALLQVFLSSKAATTDPIGAQPDHDDGANEPDDGAT